MKIIIAVVFIMLICGSIYSQTQQGTWELSFSGSMGSLSRSFKTTIGSGYIEWKSEGEYFAVALRPGYYIFDGLVLEPEIFWTASERISPTFSINGNIAYNIFIPESDITPFILAGYGIGNAVPLFERLLFRYSDKADIDVLNAGAGIKIALGEKVSLRTEYRYQRHSKEETIDQDTITKTIKNKLNDHNIFFGLSLFF